MKTQHATITFHADSLCSQIKVQLDPSEATPVFITQGVFYVKSVDKTTHYFPLCNVRTIVVG